MTDTHAHDDQRRSADAAAAAKKHEEDTRKRLGEEKSAREKTRNERMAEDAKVKPTPTQEENDLAVSGVHLGEHEPDGSAEQNVPPDAAHQQRTTHTTRETKPAASQGQQRSDYSTRSSAAKTE